MLDQCRLGVVYAGPMSTSGLVHAGQGVWSMLDQYWQVEWSMLDQCQVGVVHAGPMSTSGLVHAGPMLARCVVHAGPISASGVVHAGPMSARCGPCWTDVDEWFGPHWTDVGKVHWQPGKWRLITDTDTRLITDLSFLRGSSVNDGIDSSWCSLTYASVDDAVQRIRTLGRSALLAKFDIASTYRVVPIHPDNLCS